jgi:large subunit ribosomal protein L25
MEFIQIEVAPRESVGSSTSRRLRRDGRVPAVLCGMKKPNLNLTIPLDALRRFLRSGSHLVELKLGGNKRPAIIREVQHDAVTDEILHVDFHRVDADHEVEDHVALHFKGRAKGEAEGGVFQALEETVTVRCRPKDLPAEYLLDINDMALGDTIHVSDLERLPGVEILDEAEHVLAQCTVPKRTAAEELPEEAEAAADEAPSAEDESAAESEEEAASE